MKLVTHLYWGDPNEEFSFDLARMLLDSGADILEIGIPYTDPVCDGEVFQRACARAIANGITPPKVFEGIQKLRSEGYGHPIYLTSYFGPIFKMGVEETVKKAKEIGINGLIIPDILLEEQEELQSTSKKYGLSIIQFATIYSDKERLKKICYASTDVIYCIALPGVTGEQKGDKNQLRKLMNRLIKVRSIQSKVRHSIHGRESDNKILPVPIFVGFGIQTSEDAWEIFSYGADGIIIGTAIARIYEKYIQAPQLSLSEISAFIKDLKKSAI